MKIKNTCIRLATVALVLAGSLPLTAVADKVIEMDLRFAGSFVPSGIIHGDLSMDAEFGDTTSSVLIHVQAKGRPGRAEIRGFGGSAADDVVTFIPPTNMPATCLGSESFGGFLSIEAMEDPLVFTFIKDLSLLFANGSGQICVDFATRNSVFRFDIMFTGGTGRFDGASGYAVIEGEAAPVSNDGSFVGETGTIVGWINVLDDNDDDSDSDSDSDSDD